MSPDSSLELPSTAANPFSAADVAALLQEHVWLASGAEAPDTTHPSMSELKLRPPKEGLQVWLERAAALLGPQAAEGATDPAEARTKLEDLLSLVFHYDARAILATPDAHAVLLRAGAREVIRELAHRVLTGPEVDSDRFKEIVNALKEKLEMRGRGLFHPIRLALAGRAGEGELDRVILLLDAAAKLPFAVPVKGTRQRMVEFCAALD